MVRILRKAECTGEGSGIRESDRYGERRQKNWGGWGKGKDG